MRLVIFLFLTMGTSCLYSQSLYPGDTVYVWAEGGINLRKGNLNHSDLLIAVPYGEILTNLEEVRGLYYGNSVIEIPADTINGRIIPAIYRSGSYIRVKYGEYEGFVYSGYLSRLPTLKIVATSDMYRAEENMRQYFLRVYPMCIREFKDSLTSYEADYRSVRFITHNGFVLDEWYSPNGNGWDYSYSFNDVTIYEVYFLVNALRSFESRYKYYGKTSGEYGIAVFNESKILLGTGPFEETVIQKTGNFVVLTMSGGN